MSYAAAGADGRVAAGDVVQVGAGRYRAVDGWVITAGGIPGQPVVFRAQSNKVVLDGAIPMFIDAPGAAWDPVDGERSLFRSTVALNKRRLPYGGFVALDGERFSLAAHKDVSFLSSDVHDWKSDTPRYLGPGLAIDEAAGTLYVRLANSTAEAQCGRSFARVREPDPRRQPLWIGQSNTFGIEVRASNVVVEGFEHIDCFFGCLLIGGDNVTIRRSGGEPLYFGVRATTAKNLTIDGSTFDGHLWSERWWVSWIDVKGGEKPADHMRKCGLLLGESSNVRVTNTTLRQFFDGILAAPECHDVEVDHCTFDNIWDDAWQMYGRIYNVNFHHNLCLGAGPSRDGAGARTPSPQPGTVWIHHNVIDTTKHKVFWYRNGRPDGFGDRESIPFSTHGPPSPPDQWPSPWKLYANTVVTSTSSANGNLGIAFFGGDLPNQYPARHEVFNNIFVVHGGGIPLGRDFYSASGREVYDGNVYSGWDGKTAMWRFITTSAGVVGVAKGAAGLTSIAKLQATPARSDSQVYYPPGWEANGLEIDPRLDERYRPQSDEVRRGAVDLTEAGWPGASGGSTWRGAVDPNG